MSIFKRIISEAAVGRATVETRFAEDLLIPGEYVRGEVSIQGGPEKLLIESILFSIKAICESVESSQVLLEDGSSDMAYSRQHEVISCMVSGPLSVEPGRDYSLEFSFKLPEFTPVSAGSTRLIALTRIGSEDNRISESGSPVNVQPHPLVDSVLSSAMDIGLELSDVTCSDADFFKRGMNIPVIQVFVLRPIEGHLKERLREIELIFAPAEGGINTFLAVDSGIRLGRSDSALLHGPDSPLVCLRVDYEILDDLVLKLNSLIEERC